MVGRTLKKICGTIMLVLFLTQSAVLPLGACELGVESPSHPEMSMDDSGTMECCPMAHETSDDPETPRDCGALATCGVAALPEASSPEMSDRREAHYECLAPGVKPLSIDSNHLTPPPRR